MWREKLRRQADEHRHDDEEEALRFRTVSDLDRAKLLASLWKMAFAALGDSPPAQEERSEQALRWWQELVRRERAKVPPR
jgi:hypothetical protein